MRTITFRLLFSLLILLPLCCIPSDLFGQSEAQSSEEVLEFQRLDKTRRSIRIEEGDLIKYPLQNELGTREARAEVISWGDSTLLVRELETNRKAELNLNRISYIRLVKKGRRIAGWILVSLGIVSTAYFIAVLIIAASLFGSLVFLIFWLVVLGLILSPSLWLFFGLGLLLLKTGNRKLDRKRWRWRRLRIVRMKAPAP